MAPKNGTLREQNFINSNTLLITNEFYQNGHII